MGKVAEANRETVLLDPCKMRFTIQEILCRKCHSREVFQCGSGTEHSSSDLQLPALGWGWFSWSHYSAWSLLVFPEDRRWGKGERTTPCHSSFKELLSAGWCSAAVKNWVCCWGAYMCMHICPSIPYLLISVCEYTFCLFAYISINFMVT